jgi:hypothetical protein
MKAPKIRDSGLKPESIAHLATGASRAEASNVVLPGPPGTGHPCLGGPDSTVRPGPEILDTTNGQKESSVKDRAVVFLGLCVANFSVRLVWSAGPIEVAFSWAPSGLTFRHQVPDAQLSAG